MHYAGNLVDRRKCWILQIRGEGVLWEEVHDMGWFVPLLPGDLPPILHLLIIPHLYTLYCTCTHYTALLNIIPDVYSLYCTLHIIPSLRAPCHIYFVHIMHRTCAHHSNELQISSALEQATLGKCTHAFFVSFPVCSRHPVDIERLYPSL